MWAWATIWSAISALATIATFGVAVWAMFRWSKQEELKAKQDFRKCISLYSDYLAQVPNSYPDEQNLIKHNKQLDILMDHYIACSHAWHATEGLLDENKIVKNNWDKVCHKQIAYFEAKCTAAEVNEHCQNIIASNFVFK